MVGKLGLGRNREAIIFRLVLVHLNIKSNRPTLDARIKYSWAQLKNSNQPQKYFGIYHWTRPLNCSNYPKYNSPTTHSRRQFWVPMPRSPVFPPPPWAPAGAIVLPLDPSIDGCRCYDRVQWGCIIHPGVLALLDSFIHISRAWVFPPGTGRLPPHPQI
jgi:hypothetical protein